MANTATFKLSPLTGRLENGLALAVKFSLTLCFATVGLTACTTVTLENRRDLYFPQTVQGPYTRMKEHGIPKIETTVTTQTTTVTTSDYKGTVN